MMKTATCKNVSILITTLTLGFSMPGAAIASEEDDGGEFQYYDSMNGMLPDDMQRTGSQTGLPMGADHEEFNDMEYEDEEWPEEDSED